MPFLDLWRSDHHGAELADGIAFGNGRFVMIAGEGAWWSEDGRQWSVVTTDLCIHAVTFGDGVFVAVGDRQFDTALTDCRQMAVAVSTDGQSWSTLIISEQVLQDEPGLSGIGYGEGLFVAVGSRGRLYTSSEPGLHWQVKGSTVTTNLRGVGYGEGTFVVAGERGTILISQDHGVSWKVISAPTQQHLVDLAFGKGTFIMIGQGGAILRSQDCGSSWELTVLEDFGELRSIAYGHEAFVVVGDQVLSSIDSGESWYPVDCGDDLHLTTLSSEDDRDERQGFTGVAFGQHRFVAVGPHGQLLESEKATAQLSLQLGSKSDRYELGAEAELLLTVANTGPDLAPDLFADLVLQGDFGIAAVLPSQGSYYMVNATTLRYGVGSLREGDQATIKVVLLPQSRGVIDLSANAWADVDLVNPAAYSIQKVLPIEAPPPRPVERWLPRVFEPHVYDLRAVAYGDGIWVAVGDHGLIMGSWDDGESWRVIDQVTDCMLAAIAHGVDGFVAVGERGVTLWSRDAVHWERQMVKPAVDLHGVACCPDCIVTVGDRGNVFTRPMGGAWHLSLSPTLHTLCAVTYGGHHFTAVGRLGTVLESPDGWAWSLILCETECDLCGVAHGHENMVIVSADGSVLTPSADGWEKGHCADAIALEGVCHGHGEYLAVGGIYTSLSGDQWQECNVGQIGSFYGCAYGNGSYVVVGQYAMIMQSWPVAPPNDLELSIHCSPEVRRGQLLRTHLLAINHGPTPTEHVTVTVPLPDGVEMASVNASRGQCRQVGDAIYCELGDLHPGKAIAIVIGLKPTKVGPVTINAVLSGSGYDPDLRNNRAHCTSRVVAMGPTISLQQRVSCEHDSLLIELRIRNDGPGSVYEMTLSDPLPQGTVFLSASTSQGLFAVPKHKEHGSVSCQIGTMEAGVEVRVRLQLGMADRTLRAVSNTVNLEAANAKTLSSKVMAKLRN